MTPGRGRYARLLKDGAGLNIDAEQAVEVVTGLLTDQDFAFGKPVPPRERAMDLGGDLRRIYDAITEDCTIDDIATDAGLPPARVASGLVELELDGLLMASNGRWRRS